MDTLGCKQGWLILFDWHKSVSWKKKRFWKTEKYGKGRIHVVGC